MRDSAWLGRASLDDLVSSAREAERRLVRGEPADDGAAMELFRRAIVQREDQAWTVVIELYRPLLLGTLKRDAPRTDLGLDEHALVDRAFQRFWTAVQARRFTEVRDLATILRYLKLCLHSVLIDEARARKRQSAASIEGVLRETPGGADVDELAIARVAQRGLWEAIALELRDSDERLVVQLSFAAGLSPREILARHPDRFSSVFDVYRVKRNTIERLRRSPQLRTWFERDDRPSSVHSALLRTGASGKGPPAEPSDPVALGGEEEPYEVVKRQHAGEQSPKDIRPADLVDCSVYAPSLVAAGVQFLVQVAIHTAEQGRLARRLAREFDPDSARRGAKTLETEVEHGARLGLCLEVPGAVVDAPSQILTWRGAAQSAQFGVTLLKIASRHPVIATMTVSMGAVPIGHIKFRLLIGSQQRRQPSEAPKRVGEWARFYQQAFVSYASADRIEVLKRLQILESVRIPFFQDVLTLSPGENWEGGLYQRIEQSDLFLLFWSTAARESKRVMKEVRYALRCKHGDDAAPPEIVPVPIEGPPPVPPPRGLEHLHFNDYLLYFIR